MERRKFILGAGSTAIGASAVIGSGAFTSAEVRDRDVEVDVAEDSAGFVELSSLDEDYAEETDEGKLRLSFQGDLNGIFDGEAEGVNTHSYFTFDDVFQIRNTSIGGGDMFAWIEKNGFDDIDVDFYISDEQGNDGDEGDSLVGEDEEEKLFEPGHINVGVEINNDVEPEDDIGGSITINASKN